MSSDRAKSAVLYVLHIALIELREQARLSGDKTAYGLADLTHTMPGMIENACASGEWGSVLKEIQERAGQMGCSKWVEDRLRESDRSGS